MIAYLQGKIIAKDKDSLVCLLAGLGHRVYCGSHTLDKLTIGKEVELYIHHHLKENASDLYGFLAQDELEVFKLLLSVSSVGPKSASRVLNTASAKDVSEAIMRNDAKLLSKVSGIGKKMAERIVLELRNKISKLNLNTHIDEASLSISSDELDALMTLGYSLQEARLALDTVPKELLGSGERVKAALRNMKKI